MCCVKSPTHFTNYCVAQIFDRGDIDEFDKFLSIRQHFPYQNFPLLMFCRLPARPLFAQAISLVYMPMQNFPMSKHIYHYS